MKNCEKCEDGETWKPARAHHCSECGFCVFKMDHHCPWINNCVGQKNMKYFLQFVFYIMLASAMLSFLCVMSFINLLSSQNTRTHMNHGVSARHSFLTNIAFSRFRTTPMPSLAASWLSLRDCCLPTSPLICFQSKSPLSMTTRAMLTTSRSNMASSRTFLITCVSHSASTFYGGWPQPALNSRQIIMSVFGLNVRLRECIKWTNLTCQRKSRTPIKNNLQLSNVNHNLKRRSSGSSFWSSSWCGYSFCKTIYLRGGRKNGIGSMEICQVQSIQQLRRLVEAEDVNEKF